MSTMPATGSEISTDNQKHVVSCSYCQQQYRVLTEHLGRYTTCGHCDKRFYIATVDAISAETLNADDVTEVARHHIESIDQAPDEEHSGQTVTIDAHTVKGGVSGIESLKKGERNQRYTLGDEIARGGMGSVLSSRDVNLRRKVAMKVILKKNVTNLQIMRFIEEAQITGQLEHPSIVPVHELGIDEKGRVFYTMKLVKGKTLKEILQDLASGDSYTIERFPLHELIQILMRVCDAVSYAHSRGVVHRDLKPENIMVGDFGEVQVMDWGLAKLISTDGDDVPSEQIEALDADEYMETSQEESRTNIETIRSELNADVTLDGHILGTPQYMAPEQAEGRIDDIDATTDVYALGAMFYQILTLRPPVNGANVKEMLEKVIKGEVIPPSSYNTSSSSGTRLFSKTSQRYKKNTAEIDDITVEVLHLDHCPHKRIPRSLSAVCMKAMSREQHNRYTTVKLLQDDLRNYVRGFATAAEQASPLRQIFLFMRRHQAESYSIMGSLLIIVIMVSIFVYNLSQSERAAQQAMLDAEQSRNIAVNEKELSRQTLERLKLTVPTFIARGRQLLKEHQFVQALEHVDMALEMDAQSEAAWILQGQVLQTMLRIDEAGEAFENALSLRESEAARSGLDLCQWLISNKPKDKELSHEQLRYMHAAYLQQGRFAEAISVLSKMNADAAESYKTWKALLDEIAQKVQFEFTLGVDPDSGLLDLDVSRTQIKDLSMLKGMPLRQLHLPACDINDLSPITNAPLLHLNIDNTKIHRLSSLRDMRLKRLSLRNTPVSSITVLKDMPLTELNISYTQIRDIRSIKQMPLKKLDVSGSKVSNFSYLSGLQLESLILINSPIKDVAVLEGMPLTELWISSMYLRDISPLKTLPLERLSLYGCERLRDVAALKELESLKELIVPRGVDVSVLREHKALQLIGYSHAESYPAAEFWARYDAQQATEE